MRGFGTPTHPTVADMNSRFYSCETYILFICTLVSSDKAMIQTHVIGQCIHCARADDMAATSRIQFPWTRIPMVKKTLVYRQHLAVIPISLTPIRVIIGVGPMVG